MSSMPLAYAPGRRTTRCSPAATKKIHHEDTKTRRNPFAILRVFVVNRRMLALPRERTEILARLRRIGRRSTTNFTKTIAAIWMSSVCSQSFAAGLLTYAPDVSAYPGLALEPCILGGDPCQARPIDISL